MGDSSATPSTRSRRSRVPEQSPLGSLTQQNPGERTSCHECGTQQVTQLAMELTDGTPVTFTSCHRCEARRWEHEGERLTVDAVLTRARSKK